MRLRLTVILVFAAHLCMAQKQLLEQKEYSWPMSYSPKLTNNGRFIKYIISGPDGAQLTTVQSADGKWKKDFKAGENETSFLQDNKYLVAKLPGDTLAIMTLGTDRIRYLDHVLSYKTPSDSKTEWIACQLKTAGKPVVMLNTATGKDNKYADVKDYRFAADGRVLFLNVTTATGSDVVLVDVASGKQKTIWSGKTFSQLILDADAAHVAFIATGKNDAVTANSIWYYETGMEQATQQLTGEASCFADGSTIENSALAFGRDNQQLFFSMRKAKASTSAAKENSPEMEVWNYKDKIFYPSQSRINYLTSVPAVLNIKGGRVIRLLEQGDESILTDLKNGPAGFVLVRKTPVNWDEGYWLKEASVSYTLVSTTDGSKLKFESPGYKDVRLSPGGKYVVFFDGEKKDYMCYETASGKSTNITAFIKVPRRVKNTVEGTDDIDLLRIAGWLAGDSGVLIGDEFDIWQVDPSGKTKPVNITGGYGRSHQTRFELVKGNGRFSFFNKTEPAVAKNEKLLLTGFNEQTKEKGFFSVQLGGAKDVELLSMGAYAYTDAPEDHIKARKAEVFVLTRMTASDAPNLYYSKNLKNFTRLTQLQPQVVYNWMTCELVNWTTYGGHPSQGLLYKPENFDPSRKYPMIITYYRRFSDDLHHFIWPQISDRPNIAYYVSNGYLVFVPDLYCEKANYMQNIHDDVVSGARYLARNSWVDSTKIGITGHSFGGYVTNCLVATTPFFAAACTAAGASDMVSTFGAGTIQTMYTERGAYGIGSALWDDPETYVGNSPVFRANRVSTPLLIEHSNADTNVGFSQSVEFYVALRRAGKKVWLLEYDRDGHVLERDNALDFNLRQQQFFDHYLKGKPAPLWMTKGIPAKDKGTRNGLALDTSGDQP